MDPRTVILFMWISVLASMICENEAIVNPGLNPRPTPRQAGKRAAALPSFTTGKDMFKEVVYTLRRMLLLACSTTDFYHENESEQTNSTRV